jgi:N-acetylneuraminic acid mutarotase
MPQERVYFPAVTLNSKIYMLGGLYAENLLGYALDDVDEYDPLTDAWSTRAPLSVETNRAAGAATNGKVYLIGGYDINLTPFTTVEEYSPSVVLYYFVKN